MEEEERRWNKKRKDAKMQMNFLYNNVFFFLNFCTPFGTYLTLVSVTLSSKKIEFVCSVLLMISPRGGVMS